jgi:glutamine synthetase
MQTELRRKALELIVGRQPPASGHEGQSLTDLFGSNCFNEKAMRETLPKKVYEKVQHAIKFGHELDHEIADMVANGMKLWAIKMGATHYTHWFQPFTGATAEKHDSFISIFPHSTEKLSLEFSGVELVKGEPDASSFPSGGLRSTYEARGYTVWDPTSPAFVKNNANGVTLCVPTAFCSWNGEALDHKTPLLRSMDALNSEAVKLLHLLGYHDVKSVYSTLGIEQEFFLIDRSFYVARPDLVMCGRTLVGAKPPKAQELHDHYFASINDRILSCLQEIEWELWKLGVPLKTRHNEVAPSQYEMAPIFERSTVASDHNMLLMEMLRSIAPKHNLACLLHEKPFNCVNGSGKHNNYSLATDKGDNLLDPGKTAEVSARFLVFLTAVIRAVDVHADLLRYSIAVPGQEHRLGANEAPPAIISIYLGAELDAICNKLMYPESTQKREGANEIQLGVSVLPQLPRDTSDRNRTSPFAFTGNKFEFRAVGSSQATALPAAMLNTIVAESLQYLRTEIETEMSKYSLSASSMNKLALSGSTSAGELNPLQQAMQTVVQRTLKKHYRVVFNGNGYDQQWVAEALKRGLANHKTTPEALSMITKEKIAVLENMKVMSASEVFAQQHILLENYSKTITIEAKCLCDIATTQLLPACMSYQQKLAASVKQVCDVLGADAVAMQKQHLQKVAANINSLISSATELKRLVDTLVQSESDSLQEAQALATLCSTEVFSKMATVRSHCDMLETLVDNESWPLPKFAEMFFLR